MNTPNSVFIKVIVRKTVFSSSITCAFITPRVIYAYTICCWTKSLIFYGYSMKAFYYESLQIEICSKMEKKMSRLLH